MYLLFRALIGPEILKDWPKYKLSFKTVAFDDVNGYKHLLSCIVWYFVKWCPGNNKTIPTVLNSLIQEEIVSVD